MHTHLEVERKFAAEPDALLPAFGDLAVVDATREFHLVATYFDTPDYALARAGVTLRRRTGGSDAGWHAKLPKSADNRVEVHADLDSGRSAVLVPDRMRAELSELVGLAPLVPIAELRTHRIERDLCAGRGGQVLGVLCDDTVLALRSTGRTDSVERWREIELELAEGSPDWFGSVGDAIAATTGFSVAADASKLAHALGPLPEITEHSPDTSARTVLLDHLAEQVGVIQGRAADLVVDAPGAVHKTRVATRRLRSALRTFRDLMDRSITDPLRMELKWFATELGGPRDAEVLKARLLADLERLPDDAVDGPVIERITTELDATHDRARETLLEAMESPRYVLLHQALVRLLTHPPLLDEADRPAGQVLRDPINKARKRVLRWDRYAHERTGDEHWEALHETRKKAKAMRYACEAVSSAFPEAGPAAKAWEAVTETFGGLQDGVVARQRLHELADIARAHGESTFSYGVLYGWEINESEHDREVSARALTRANAKEHRSWLRR
ncbi:CHAD domain-containing protein [Enemella sp. A6]|uniref:CYTH and CHAD domain-containing protein n=1 Tax=Enemella sp. A6 TaxID=3440152 RepID=UPI003EB9B81B